MCCRVICCIFAVSIVAMPASTTMAYTFDANAAMVADVTGSFANPYGPWRVGYMPNGADWVTGSVWFTSAAQYQNTATAGWVKVGSSDGTPSVAVNYTGVDENDGMLNLKKDQILLAPGSDGAMATIRWTAPTTGVVDVHAVFSNAFVPYSATTDFWMQKSTQPSTNGTGHDLFAYGTIDGSHQSVTKDVLDVPVDAGNVIYALVGTHWNGNGGDCTGLQWTITYHVTPEPSSTAILCSALIGMMCYAWRRRR
jgi:hypothetical protein